MQAIELDVKVDASPQTVWRMLTESEDLASWFPSRAIIDARVGGHFEVHFEHTTGKGNHMRKGSYREVRPYTRLVHSWQIEVGGESRETVVEWDLEEENGGTRVRLRHSGWGEGGAWQDSIKDHTNGWGFFLNNLAGIMAGGEDVRPAHGISTPAARSEI